MTAPKLALAAASLVLSATALAQYPTKPIRIISSFPPGGTTDVLARIIATEMTKTVSQPVVVENKTGAGGIVGTLIASGETEIGFQQISELVHFPGIDYVGPLPGELQRMTVFSAGIHSGAKQADAARALVKFITAPAAASVIRKHGLEPA